MQTLPPHQSRRPIPMRCANGSSRPHSMRGCAAMACPAASARNLSACGARTASCAKRAGSFQKPRPGATAPPRRRIGGGSPTSPTSQPGPAFSISPWGATPSAARSWAGRWQLTCAPHGGSRRAGSGTRLSLPHFEDWLAEREGFEPSVPVTQYARLAIWCLRPLGHLSAQRNQILTRYLSGEQARKCAKTVQDFWRPPSDSLPAGPPNRSPHS